MSNLIMVCHGELNEDSSVDLRRGQTLQLRGNYGEPLMADVAMAVVQAVLSNPYATAHDIGRQVRNYRQEEPVEGERSVRPDIYLSGDDHLPCFVMNLATRRWRRLGSRWQSRLRDELRRAPTPVWFNLCCCTSLQPDSIDTAFVRKELEVEDWSDVIPGMQ